MKQIIVRQTIDSTFLKGWQNLWDKSKEGHFFNTPDWFLASCEVYNIKDFKIITIEEDGELVLVLPLVRQKVFGISIWTCLGGKFVNKSPLLVREPEKVLLKDLTDFLIKQGDFYLQEISSEIAEIICQTNTKIVKKEASINPYLSLSFDPFSYLSSKNKSQIRGILRKNEKELSFKTFIGDENALETVFELDRRSSKREQGKATFVTQQDKQFFRELLKRMPKSFVIDFVYFQNTAVVYGVGFVYKNIFHASNTAFDAQYRFLRPGKLLANYRLNKLQEQKFDFIDFGRGNSTLKQEFTKLAKIQYNVFYVQSALSQSWLLSTQKIIDGILNNKRLYNTYLFFKKRILYR